MMKNQFSIIFLLLVFQSAFAQEINLKGRVFDKGGQGIPFVSVYIKNTSTGTSANAEGAFELKVPAKKHNLVFRAIGFSTVEREIDPQDISFLQVPMEGSTYQLSDVTISAYREDPAYEVIKNAIRRRRFHLKEVDQYSVDVYIKGMQKLLAAPRKFLGKDIDEIGGQLGLDSNRTGILYLSESESRLSYMEPGNYREEMISSKVSGNNRAFSYNRASDLRVDFYENLVSLEGLGTRPFISPISDNALFYYAYRLIGTTIENGQMINKIEVIPKRSSDPVFRGHIFIIEDSWRIHGTDLSITKESGLNFLDTVSLKQQFNQVGAKLWLPGSIRFDFRGAVFGFHFGGYYIALLRNYNLQPNFNRSDFREVLKVSSLANKQDSAYWALNRPIPLTAEEKEDYDNKKILNNKRQSKAYLDSLDKVQNKFRLLKFLFTSGYNHRNRSSSEYFNFPSILRSSFYNTVEGFGINYGILYSKRLDSLTGKSLSLSARIRYGFSSEKLHGSVSAQIPVGQSYLGFRAGSDVVDLNGLGSISAFGNSINSLFYERNFLKLYEKKFLYLSWSRRIAGIQTMVSSEYSNRRHLKNSSDYKIKEWRSREFTSNNPFFPDSEQDLFPENQSLRFSLRASYNFSNKYATYPSGRYYRSSKYPVLGISYSRAFNGLFGSDTDFQLLSADLTKTDVALGIYGRSSFWLGAGTFLNKEMIYYPDFKHFIGNRSLSFEPRENGFLFLDFYRNSTSESYLEAHLRHNFSGFILNKVPLIRDLKLQEIAGFNYLKTPLLGNYTEIYVGLQYLTFRVMYGVSAEKGVRHDKGVRISYIIP